MVIPEDLVIELGGRKSKSKYKNRYLEKVNQHINNRVLQFLTHIKIGFRGRVKRTKRKTEKCKNSHHNSNKVGLT